MVQQISNLVAYVLLVSTALLCFAVECRLIPMTPSSVAENGQPVLLYNAAYDEYVFVSNDKMGRPPDNVVETHKRTYIHERRNLFIIQAVSSDLFRIYNPSTRKWLFVSNDRDGRDHVVEAHPSEPLERRIRRRNEFKFESCGNNQYRIYNPSYKEYLFVSSFIVRGDNVVLSHPHRDEERNKFTLILFGNLNVASVEFFVDQGEITNTVPVMIATKQIENYSSVTQSTSLEVKQTVADTSHFQHQIGISLTGGTEFTTGIPFVAEGKVKFEAGFAYSHSWGTAKTIGREITKSFTMNGLPNKRTIGQCIVQKSTLNVPYRMTVESSDGKRFFTHGIWQGVSYGSITFRVRESPL